jgi:thymidylate kinase
MILVLNGPLGIGKSTLADALSESIEQCVMLDGDHLVAANPPQADELGHLHSTISLLVAHHRSFGYRHFVINHLWTSSNALDDLRSRLVEVAGDARVYCFLLTLPEEENLRRIRRRAGARAIDDLDLEQRISQVERKTLQESGDGELGEPFDVSGTPSQLVERMLRRLGHR